MNQTLLDWLVFVNEGPDNCGYFEIRNGIDEFGVLHRSVMCDHGWFASTQAGYSHLQDQITTIQWYGIFNIDR